MSPERRRAAGSPGPADTALPLARAISPAELGRTCEHAALLDVRDEDAFARGHLAGSGNVPVADLRERRAELPSRDTPVVVAASAADEARAGAEGLRALGYADVSWVDAPLAAVEHGLDSRAAAARLWRPAPFLEEVLPQLRRGRAVDLAAGSGREAVFLALHGFDVEAWDVAPEALARAAALALRNGVRIETVERDLEADDPALSTDHYDLVVCFRFLQRPLFRFIERALRPGGHLVYETYRVGQERFGRPTKSRYLLQPGELARAFPSLEVLHFEEREPAGGPVTARLLARRPGSSDPPAGP